MNKIADTFFLIGILLIFLELGTTDIILVNSLIPYYINYVINFFDASFIDIVSFLLFIGVIGKSAQIGFHT